MNNLVWGDSEGVENEIYISSWKLTTSFRLRLCIGSSPTTNDDNFHLCVFRCQMRIKCQPILVDYNLLENPWNSHSPDGKPSRLDVKFFASILRSWQRTPCAPPFDSVWVCVCVCATAKIQKNRRRLRSFACFHQPQSGSQHPIWRKLVAHISRKWFIRLN